MPDPSEPRPVQRSRISDPRAMSFGEHLEELRRRLIFALLGVLPIFIAALVFGERLINFILKPAQAQLRAASMPTGLISTSPLEVIGAYLKVAIVVTIVFGVPFILYQLWLFIAPGLYEQEKRFARFLIPLSLILSITGLAFLYYVMLPAMLAFLIGFGAEIGAQTTKTVETPAGMVFPTAPILEGDPVDPPPGSVWYNNDLKQLRFNTVPPVAAGEPVPKPIIRGVPLTKAAGIRPEYKVSEYISLVFTTSLAFVLGFQTPVVVLLLGWIGIVSLAKLRKSRKYALFAAFALSAVLSPSPDPVSMIVLAIPLYFLYELGLLLLKFFPPGRIARGIRVSDLTHAPKSEGPDAGDD